ncbi:MAG: hypothetical protein ACOCVM_04815, partial [Desulfovibrionaceae bacterium]
MTDERDARLDVEVECYAGGRGDETPRRFRFGGRSVAVEDVLDRWHGPDYRYFKVMGEDGCAYILRHDERQDRWELTMMDARSNRNPL